MADPDSPLVKKLDSFVRLTSEERSYLADLQSNPVKIKRGEELLREGLDGRHVFVMHTGWASSYKDLIDGGRQIINFPVPGDCVGLRGVLLRATDHSFAVLTDANVSVIDASRILKLLDENNRLRTAFLWSAARDEAMAVEHLVSVGRRGALERTAHFFMELGERLMLVGLATSTEFKCPLNQYVLADALGLTAIHVNRVLRKLREMEVLTVHGGKVAIHDVERMKKLAGYQGVAMSE